MIIEEEKQRRLEARQLRQKLVATNLINKKVVAKKAVKVRGTKNIVVGILQGRTGFYYNGMLHPCVMSTDKIGRKTYPMISLDGIREYVEGEEIEDGIQEAEDS